MNEGSKIVKMANNIDLKRSTFVYFFSNFYLTKVVYSRQILFPLIGFTLPASAVRLKINKISVK